MKKTCPRRSAAAFTLIELLVVISIIAILASLTFTGVQGALLSAKKVQAKNDMAQIANAVQFYYTEYGQYPASTAMASGTSDTCYGVSSYGGDNHNIIDILRCTSTWAVTSSGTSQNPRQIQFIQPKVVSVKKGGVYAPSSGSDGNWYDPWGTQYVIFIDGDYAGDIDPTPVFSGLADSSGKVPQSVGVASVGYYYVKKRTNPQPTVAQGILSYTGDATVKISALLSWQ
jgi:prepilin-type N-terminal cleavage/methylation domain-containing protein